MLTENDDMKIKGSDTQTTKDNISETGNGKLAANNGELTVKSRIREVYAHSVGRDVIRKILLQLGRSERVISNPIVGNIRLKTLPKLTRGMVDDKFLDTLLVLLNSEKTNL